ncbi:MAG: hypothetical protein ACE5EL_02705, partial [Anaerolineae bacterium]
SPVQSGRLVWGPDGLYLHEVFARPEEEAPLPLRGYVVRTAAGDVAESHPGTDDAWFVAAAWVDGQPAHIEAAPGPPPLAYRQAVIGRGPALDLDLKATAAAWARDGGRLALVQRGPDGADEVVVRTVGGDQPSSGP